MYVIVVVYFTTFESLIVYRNARISHVMFLKEHMDAMFESSEPLYLLRLMGMLVPSLHIDSNTHIFIFHIVCDPEDLLVDLPSGTWSPLTSGQPGHSFNGGNVTFDGISEGSTATYTTHGDYFVSGGQLFQTMCRKNGWIYLPTIYIAGLMAVFIIN